MICALGFHAGDYEKCTTLLDWINELGGCAGHDLLLVADAGVPRSRIVQLCEKHRRSWRSATAITNRYPVSGWIAGSNSLFLEAAMWSKGVGDWLWLETDCVPVKAGWLDEIEKAYRLCGQPYFGHLYACNGASLPKQLLSGIAVYNRESYNAIKQHVGHTVAFDVTLSEHFVKDAAHTRLIKHIWGTPRFPPRFYRELPANPLPNSFTKAFLGDCVLFHRVKDSSLIDLLRGRPTKPMLRWLVWPFCNKDAPTALKNMRWMLELNRYDWNVVLSYPANTNSHLVNEMRKVAAQAFTSVSENRYADRDPSWWPPNVAFRHAAFFMEGNVKEAWLWMEPDAVPLRADWLDVLRSQYGSCSELFAAPHVQGMSHCNGTGIYPADTPQRIPLALAERHDAWDTKMAPEMMHDCKDLMPYFYHCWTMDADNFYACGGGGSPTFADHRMVDRIPSESVVFHRNKDLTLIDRLREKKAQLA